MDKHLTIAMILVYFGSFPICYCYGKDLSVIDLSALPPSPCHLTRDQAYGGVVVDCQSQGLESLPPQEWIPEETTSLLLQSNSISNLDNSSFVKAKELRYLSLAHNRVRFIDPWALRHNKKIRVIDLESNLLRLDNNSLTGPLFHNMSSLEELRLATNDLYPSSTFAPTLLLGFPNLRILTLDTFEGDLYFNGIFKHTKRLSKLALTGAFSTIRNDSFEDFEDIKLIELRISSISSFESTYEGAFSYLKYLDLFNIRDINQGTTLTMESLAPFVHKNFTDIQFHGLTHDKVLTPSNFQKDILLDQYTARYLSKICVRNFVFTNNNLFFIEPGTLTGPLWSNCLESIDLSMNPLLGNVMELILLGHMKYLQSFQFTDRKYSFIGRQPSEGGKFTTENFDMADLAYQRLNVSEEDVSGLRNLLNFERKGIELENDKRGFIITGDNVLTTTLTAPNGISRTTTKNKSYLPSLFIRLPINLEYLDLSRLSHNSMSLDVNVFIVGGENLKELRLSDSGVSDFTGTFHGIENIKIADFSKNDGCSMSSSFLRSFPKLSTLLLSGSSLETAILESPKMFQSLHMLEHLDLSSNNLHFLPPTLLSNNRKLKDLNLAGNSLTRFPLLLHYNPILQLLDLRANSFLDFSPSERENFDKKSVIVPKFKLLLEGNVFSCSCSSIKFLHWLQTTNLDLDRTTNDYSCLLMDGQVTTTNELKNLENFWRLCNGKSALYISVILMCLTALGFSLFTIGIKFQTQIQATLIQYFGRNFVIKTPGDYTTGVYIGYADQDTDFACLMLRDIVENQLQYSTYVHHRDLLPASNIAESIVSAINSSWRVLLYVSEHYLEDQWSYLAMKTATYSVGSSNPGRIVLIVGSDDIGHMIPVYLLNATREDSIIKLNERDLLSHVDIEALRTALQG